MNFIEMISKRYEVLKEKDWFAHELDTSSPLDKVVEKLLEKVKHEKSIK
jgi:hypothetical protein